VAPTAIQRALRALLAVALLAVLIAPLDARALLAQEQPVVVTIVHDTHFHGSLTGQDGVTLAHYAALAKSIREQNPNTLIVGNGDDLAPSLMSSLFRGQHMVDALGALGLDVNTMGNHEFDYGPDNLLEKVRASAFPWVTANVLDRRTGDAFGSEVGVRRFTIKEVAGVKIGVTGVAPAETPQVTSIGPYAEVRDPNQALAEVIPQMRAAGAQVTLVLSHLSWPASEAAAAAVPGIDVIVGDHAGQALDQPNVIGSTIVSRRGDELRILGQLDLTIQGGKIVSHQYTGHKLTRELPTDPAVAGIIDQYQAQLDVRLGEVIGQTSVALDARRTENRVGETNLGNFIADTLRTWGSADVPDRSRAATS
jgi:2',3'-cyclic-nucleotide 2'-phosphodiesterase (5'-nucleotidase family)